jgi:hypothetical protein
MNANEEKILEMLKDIRPEYDFTASTDFIGDGLLDSFDMVTFVSELEDAFGIVIDGLDIVPENFATVETILATVRKNGGNV